MGVYGTAEHIYSVSAVLDNDFSAQFTIMNAFHQLNKDLCPITTLTKLIHIPCKVCTSITSLYSKLTGHIATKVENELFLSNRVLPKVIFCPPSSFW